MDTDEHLCTVPDYLGVKRPGVQISPARLKVPGQRGFLTWYPPGVTFQVTNQVTNEVGGVGHHDHGGTSRQTCEARAERRTVGHPMKGSRTGCSHHVAGVGHRTWLRIRPCVGSLRYHVGQRYRVLSPSSESPRQRGIPTGCPVVMWCLRWESNPQPSSCDTGCSIH